MTATDTRVTSEVLNLAADLIEERGWTRGNIGMLASEETPLCLEGALQAALGAGTCDWTFGGRSGWDPEFGDVIYHYPDETCSAYVAVVRHLSRTPFTWNDESDRTADEVVEVLRACAVIEAAKENPGPRVEALVFDAERVIEVDW